MRISKWRIIVPILIVAVLTAAFYFGGDSAGLQGWQLSEAAASAEASVAPTSTVNAPSTAPTDTAGAAPTPTPTASSETGTDAYQTAPVPSGLPEPVEPEAVSVGTAAYTCTLSVSCATILSNMDALGAEKQTLVPEDGWILKPTSVTFYEGESVFNVLSRTLKQQGIHLEFVNTPGYNSAYIEGIGNLYEFDVGELSGWLYRVNGWVPNYGCSRYQLQNGDVIEWLFTCDMGYDLGSGGMTGGLQNEKS